MKPAILLVEDDDDMRYLLERAARRCALFSEVNIAPDAWQALEWLAACDPAALPHVIVTDLKMPGLSGADLIRQLKQNPATQHLPVAVLTSSDWPGDKTECLAAGAIGFYNKPASVADLELILRTVLGSVGLAPPEPVPPAS